MTAEERREYMRKYHKKWRTTLTEAYKQKRREQCRQRNASLSEEQRIYEREQRRKRREAAGPEKIKAKWQAYKQRWPEKIKARRAVTNAVYRGSIKKPNACQGCGDTFAPEKLHGHHEDYSQLLEVEWLCACCHGRRHQIQAAA